MKIQVTKVKVKREIEIPVEVTIKGITTKKMKKSFEIIQNADVDITIDKSELKSLRESFKTEENIIVKFTYEEI